LDKQYDIAIIGAGPAGSMSAYNLAKHFKVLIVEAHGLPRNKSCSGILIKKSVDILDKYFDSIPDDVKCTPYETNGITIVNEYMVPQDFPDKGLNILRDKFDYWLVQNAIKAGADLIDNSKVVKLDENENGVTLTIKGDNVYKINSKIVIACDGVSGNSRMMTNTPKQNKLVTYQKYYNARASIDRSKFYAYISKDFSEYDSWINTKNNHIVVGTIAKTLTKSKYFHNQFISFLKKEINFEIIKEIKDEAWYIPLVIPDFPIVLRNRRVFFAGEVAGLLNPFGEGISIALISGLCLSNACIKQKSLELTDCAEIELSYNSSLSNEIEYMKRQWKFIKCFYPYFWNNVMQNLGGSKHDNQI
jgi:flavin-dependent dehydrogenase